MGGEFTYVDLFATKGAEYMLVLAFLALLVPFWQVLNRPVRAGLRAARRLGASIAHWFRLPEGIYYHLGHSWAMPQGEVVRVGVDDFAQRLVGRPQALHLPPVGSRVEQGEVAWRLSVDSKAVDMLSPVTGEVVAVNERVLERPELINQDPYGEGWLLAVKPHNHRANFRNLLRGKVANAWMRVTADALQERMGGELGTVLQDGGLPVTGLARALWLDGWDRMAREFLLTAEG